MAKITSIEEKNGVYTITTDNTLDDSEAYETTGADGVVLWSREDVNKVYLKKENWLLTTLGFRAPSELSVGDEIPDNPSEKHIHEELDKIEAVYYEEE